VKAGVSAPTTEPRYVTSDLANVAPFVRNPLNVRRVMHCVLLATTPCVGMALYNTGYQTRLALAQGIPAAGWQTRLLAGLGLDHASPGVLDCLLLGAFFFAPILLSVWLAGALAEQGFARARGRRPDHVALPVIALLFSLGLPATLPLWQAALGCAIGVVIGKEIFGGLGRNFVNPVVVGLAFLYFAYPGSLSGDAIWVPVAADVPTSLSVAARSGLTGLAAAGRGWLSEAFGCVPGAMGETSAVACLLGCLVLLRTGVASWRIVVGGCLGLSASVVALQGLGVGRPIAELPWHWHLVSGSFAFGLVYLATDPVTSATTNPGRWLYGVLIGTFVAIVRVTNPAHQEGVLLALLLGNVCAPLLDRVVSLVWMQWNRVSRAG
jgi:Na+-transporting NADH:ubiquinone oxidoreductase subunit B